MTKSWAVLSAFYQNSLSPFHNLQNYALLGVHIYDAVPIDRRAIQSAAQDTILRILETRDLNRQEICSLLSAGCWQHIFILTPPFSLVFSTWLTLHSCRCHTRKLNFNQFEGAFFQNFSRLKNSSPKMTLLSWVSTPEVDPLSGKHFVGHCGDSS